MFQLISFLKFQLKRLFSHDVTCGFYCTSEDFFGKQYLQLSLFTAPFNENDTLSLNKMFEVETLLASSFSLFFRT